MTYTITVATIAIQWHNIKTTDANLVSLNTPKLQNGFDYRALS